MYSTNNYSSKILFSYSKHRISWMFFLYIYILVATIFQLLFLEYSIVGIMSFVLLSIISVYSVEFELAHPLTLYVPIFTLYSIGYPVLKLLDIDIVTVASLDPRTLITEWIAICSFIIFMGNKRIKYDDSLFAKKSHVTFLIKIAYVLISALTLMGFVIVMKNGYLTKNQIADNSNILLRISELASYSFVIFALLLNSQPCINRKRKLYSFAFGAVLMLLGMLINGERSLILNYLICFLIYYSVLSKKLDIKKIILIVIALVIFFGISSSLKMAFVRGSVAKIEEKFIISFFKSDFFSASFNLNYLFLNERIWAYKYGTSYLYAFLSPIDFLIPGIKNLSLARWNQSTFWPLSSTGYGFTIVGEALMNFGYIGVFAFNVFFALLTKKIYYKSNISRYHFIRYLFFISLSMYAVRADFANILSPFFKYSILITFVLAWIENSIKKSK